MPIKFDYSYIEPSPERIAFYEALQRATEMAQRVVCMNTLTESFATSPRKKRNKKYAKRRKS